MNHGVAPEPPLGRGEIWRAGFEQAMQGVRDRGHVEMALSAALESTSQHIDTLDQWELDRAELAALRARDEAAKRVVQLLRGSQVHRTDETELYAALDALARAHEDEDGGRDR